MNNKGRVSILGLAGGYLMYLAYQLGSQLFMGEEAPETTMSPALMVLFTVLFAVVGCGLLVYGIVQWRRLDAEEKHSDNNQSPVK